MTNTDYKIGDHVKFIGDDLIFDMDGIDNFKKEREENNNNFEVIGVGIIYVYLKSKYNKTRSISLRYNNVNLQNERYWCINKDNVKLIENTIINIDLDKLMEI